MEKSIIARHTGGGGKEPQGRQGFLSKIPFFKFVSKSNFSVSNVNKYYVGVKPQPTMNCIGRIWKRSIKDSPCHPELAAPLVADVKEAYKGGCSQSISGSYRHQECSPICTQKSNVGLNPQSTLISVSSRQRSIVMQCLSPHSPRKVAFTLAEVLITLGIIGIVAAMTLPGLIAKYQEKQWRVAYKKAYSEFSQAYLRLQEDGEFVDISNIDLVEDSETGAQFYVTEAIGQNFRAISKYFNTVKTCFDNNADKCWVCNEGQSGYISGGAPDWLGCDGTSYAFVESSGLAWYLYRNNEYPILVDVNGNNRPNKLGKDRFVMKFASNNPNLFYASNVDRISPFNDYISKSRWCPEGNCLYKTWLLK